MMNPACRVLICAVLAWLAQGCATAPPPASQMLETDDLAVVTADALALSERIPSDDILVVFDIDNTLLAMEQDLGSDQWYEWQKAEQARDPCSEWLVGDRLAVQGALYFASAMRPTQPDAADQVRQLQDRGFKVIALTSRGPDFRLQTFRELRRNGISFWPGAIEPRRGWAEDFVPEGGTRASRYEDGVFLTAGQHKGVMLAALLNRTRMSYPRVIIMADDKEENLQALMETFQALGSSVRAWRYAGEDDEVAAFDAEASHQTWQAIRPSLRALNEVLGPDNYDFPDPIFPEGCGSFE